MKEDVNPVEQRRSRDRPGTDTRANYHWLTLIPKAQIPRSKVFGSSADFTACAMSHLGLLQKAMGQTQDPVRGEPQPVYMSLC